MTRRAVPTAVAVAVALAGAVVAAPTATAAPATPARTTAPAATQAAKTFTHRVDIDGDGRKDTVTLRLVSSRGDVNGYRLAVRTAKGRSSSLPVYVTENMNNPTPRDLWVGATGIDGVRGNEVMLDLGGGVGDFAWIHTYTWRNGKLTPLAAPNSTRTSRSWTVTFPPFPVSGWTFSMKGDTRYVVHHQLNASPSGRTYSGTNTTYRWTPKGWKKVSTAKSGVVSRKTADKMSDFRGLIWR